MCLMPPDVSPPPHHSYLIALQTLPGTIVFPFYNTAGLLLASAFASLVWRERLGRLGKAGMVLATIAVVLLN